MGGKNAIKGGGVQRFMANVIKNDLFFGTLPFKGGVQIIKMEIKDGFFHEGGAGSRVPPTYS